MRVMALNMSTLNVLQTYTVEKKAVSVQQNKVHTLRVCCTAGTCQTHLQCHAGVQCGKQNSCRVKAQEKLCLCAHEHDMTNAVCSEKIQMT